MKKIIIPITCVVILNLFGSCTNQEEIANDNKKLVTDQFCSCMDEIVSDTLIDMNFVKLKHDNCFDSIVVKNKFNLEKQFISKFDTIQKVLDKTKEINQNISSNVNSILKKNTFEMMDIFYDGEYRVFDFDGKMVTQTLYEISDLLSWYETNKWSGVYKIEISNDGLIHVILTFEGEDQIYSLRKATNEESLNLIKNKAVEEKDKPVYILTGKRELYSKKK